MKSTAVNLTVNLRFFTSLFYDLLHENIHQQVSFQMDKNRLLAVCQCHAFNISRNDI